MDRFFSILGKIFVVLGVAGVLIGGGYFLGTKLNKPTQGISTTAISPTTSSGVSTTVTPTVSPQQKDTTGRFVVTGGGASATTFATAKYMLSGVAGWVLSKTEQPGINKVVLTKGDYAVSIYQAAIGGGGCTFPGDKPSEMSIALTVPVAEIPLLDGTMLKRGQADSSNNPGKETFDVCQKGTDGSYGNLTYYGAITYVVPQNPDSATLAEMDAMVGSLQKQ